MALVQEIDRMLLEKEQRLKGDSQRYEQCGVMPAHKAISMRDSGGVR
jgi:hypothetical protein